MSFTMKILRAGLMAGVAVFVSVSGAAAGASSPADANARLQSLESEISSLQAEVQDLKRSQSQQYADLRQQSQGAGDVRLSLNGGKPVLKTADGAFSFEPRLMVQYDTAYYAQGEMPAGIDFSSGSNFRRARFGADGTLFTDWAYEFIYDFGGSGVEGTSITSAYIQYNGLAPFHFRIGAYAPPESFEDTTSPTDFLFLERAQPTDVARSIAGGDGRDAATVFAYGDNYFAALSYTGSVVGTGAQFDEQQALVGRAAYRLVNTGDANLALGADASYVFRLPDIAPGPNSPNGISLSERPELNVDDNSIRLVSTGTLLADKVWHWGAEAAGNWRSLYGQGGYYNIHVNRTGGLGDASFAGWYAQASWVLTGEARTWNPARGAFSAPKPADPFTLGHAGTGAREIAARYSVLDLNDNAGIALLPTPAGGVRGGEQKIWTAGISWYPNTAIRFMLDYQHTDVNRLDPLGASLDARLDAVSLRTQVAF